MNNPNQRPAGIRVTGSIKGGSLADVQFSGDMDGIVVGGNIEDVEMNDVRHLGTDSPATAPTPEPASPSPPGSSIPTVTPEGRPWFEKPLGLIWIAVVGGLLVAAAGWAVSHYFG